MYKVVAGERVLFGFVSRCQRTGGRWANMTMLGAFNSLQNATFVVDHGPLRARIDPPVSECLSHSAMNLKRLGFFCCALHTAVTRWPYVFVNFFVHVQVRTIGRHTRKMGPCVASL